MWFEDRAANAKGKVPPVGGTVDVKNWTRPNSIAHPQTLRHRVS